MSRSMSLAREHLATVSAPEHAQSSNGPLSEPGEPRRAAHARAAEVVSEIAADAAAHPEVYLRATVVPEGGE
jgi:hypothetical protein